MLQEANKMIDELDEMLNPETLPIYKWGRKAHYEGSIDKTGKNADWDWHLYQDDNDEWVLFEQYGPGCIYNFVQHRYISSKEPTFRFYFDDEKTPRFTIKPSEFGEKYPFIEPLAGKFVGINNGVCVIRIARSFVPMPFTSYCKVTSDTYLSMPGGGWGHIVYHTYSEDSPKNSFDPSDRRYRALAQKWGQIGRDPLRAAEKQRELNTDFALEPGDSKMIYSASGAGLVCAVRIRTCGFSKEDLLDLWIRAAWDDHEPDDIVLPFGAFFANELGHHQVKYLFAGSDSDGGYYMYFPMPYKQSAAITIENRGKREIRIDYAAVESTSEYNVLYTDGKFGYLMSTPYYEKKHTKGKDSVIAEMSGVSGHVVSSTVTGYAFAEGKRADCEGDAHIHFDGIRTPSIESDGSESYACYGWGFASPPQSNPISGYDGKDIDISCDWSMTRELPGDCYPFHDRLHFAFESFEDNNDDMYHSGAVLYYGERKTLMTKIGKFQEGDEQLASYFEGDDDYIEFNLTGTYGKSIAFSVQCAGYDGIVLRRVSDQCFGRQMARVYVDDVMCDYPWYFPDMNPYKRLLEDEYVIPGKLICGKESVNIRIEPEECGGRVRFNQFGIEIFGLKYCGI